jgi:hypothetical protein
VGGDEIGVGVISGFKMVIGGLEFENGGDGKLLFR